MPPARIMIVEDDGLIANHIDAVLRKAGYEVTFTATSSDEALGHLRQLCPSLVFPDLILMDIHIEGTLDGIETTTKLREIYDIPVIYLTAQSDRQTLDRAKLTGSFEVIKKPFNEQTLLSTVESAIQKHRTAETQAASF